VSTYVKQAMSFSIEREANLGSTYVSDEAADGMDSENIEGVIVVQVELDLSRKIAQSPSQHAVANSGS
jgi:C4-dicarboxylate-specific signal transduction histidine kinase